MTTRMREIAAFSLARAAGVSSTAASAEVDVSKYYVSPGTREMMAIASIMPTGADTDETIASKLQESATTVDSDFTDISGAAFTGIAQEDTTGLYETVYFTMSAGKKYLREHHTVAGTTVSFGLHVSAFAVKRSA